MTLSNDRSFNSAILKEVAYPASFIFQDDLVSDLLTPQVQEPEAQEKVKEELREKVKVPISVREEEEEEIIL